MDMWMTWMVTKRPVGRNQGNKVVLGNVTVKVGDTATIWGPINLLIVLGCTKPWVDLHHCRR